MADGGWFTSATSRASVGEGSSSSCPVMPCLSFFPSTYGGSFENAHTPVFAYGAGLLHDRCLLFQTRIVTIHIVCLGFALVTCNFTPPPDRDPLHGAPCTSGTALRQRLALREPSLLGAQSSYADEAPTRGGSIGKHFCLASRDGGASRTQRMPHRKAQRTAGHEPTVPRHNPRLPTARNRQHQVTVVGVQRVNLPSTYVVSSWVLRSGGEAALPPPVFFVFH